MKYAGSWWSERNNYHISTCLQKVDVQDVAVNFEATARHTGHKLMNTFKKKQDVSP